MSACIKNKTRESMLVSPESLRQMATPSLTLFKMAKPHYMHLRHEADKSTKNKKRNISNTRDKGKKTLLQYSRVIVSCRSKQLNKQFTSTYSENTLFVM